jgi:hypothetical protein
MKKLVKNIINKANEMITKVVVKATAMLLKSRTLLCSRAVKASWIQPSKS